MSDKICYLDFDRTISKYHLYNDTMEINEGVNEFISKIRRLDYKVVLNTFRADLNNGSLKTALIFLKENEIEIDEVVSSKITPEPFQMNSQIIFIDDEAFNIPLKKSDVEWNVKLVDFFAINKLLFELYGI